MLPHLAVQGNYTTPVGRNAGSFAKQMHMGTKLTKSGISCSCDSEHVLICRWQCLFPCFPTTFWILQVYSKWGGWGKPGKSFFSNLLNVHDYKEKKSLGNGAKEKKRGRGMGVILNSFPATRFSIQHHLTSCFYPPCSRSVLILANMLSKSWNGAILVSSRSKIWNWDIVARKSIIWTNCIVYNSCHKRVCFTSLLFSLSFNARQRLL